MLTFQISKNHSNKLPNIQYNLIAIYLLINCLIIFRFHREVIAKPLNRPPHRCSYRLENALEHMRHRPLHVKSLRSHTPHQTPYTLYQSLYGQQDNSAEEFYDTDNDNERRFYGRRLRHNNLPSFGYGKVSKSLNLHSLFGSFRKQLYNRQPHKLIVNHVDVEDLEARIPTNDAANWVQVDKCKFSLENYTLDTRLIFPDLTLSGKVILQPSGGKCSMILRLRHAGIEFRTVPISLENIPGEETRRIGAASVRTDSHFAEPGFISVFAHSCQGPNGIQLRKSFNRENAYMDNDQLPPTASIEQTEFDARNSRHISDHLTKLNYDWLNNNFRSRYTYGDIYNLINGNQNLRYHEFPMASNTPSNLSTVRDEINFNDDILNISDDAVQNVIQPDARAFADLFTANLEEDGQKDQNLSNALTKELERIFALGVRGLLTTYMQKTLQPAIKETLMQNMGYTVSYG